MTNQQNDCAPSEDSDQPGHPPSLFRVFAVLASAQSVQSLRCLGIRPVCLESSLSAWRNLGSLASHWAHIEDSDQTGRMRRLIWVFAGCTCYFVGFVGLCLKSACHKARSSPLHYLLRQSETPMSVCAGWSVPLLFAYGKADFVMTWLK